MRLAIVLWMILLGILFPELILWLIGAVVSGVGVAWILRGKKLWKWRN